MHDKTYLGLKPVTKEESIKPHISAALLIAALSVTLLAACAPQTQNHNAQPASTDSVTEDANMATTDTALLGNTLNVPDTSATLIIDDSMLAGELASFELDNDKGTLRMLSSPLQLDADFSILPVEVLRVSGAGGIYLLLLERSGETFTQRDAASLGQKVRLLKLESQDNLLTATTVDASLGKFPDTEPTAGGVLRFQMEDSVLVEQEPRE